MTTRAEFLKRLESWGVKLAKDVLELKEPVMEIPARTLSNTVWDEKARMLKLGPEKMHRRFLDMKEARRFMQTVLMLVSSWRPLGAVPHDTSWATRPDGICYKDAE